MSKKPKAMPRSASPEYGDDIKRLNRVIGQVEGIQTMLAQGRELEAVLIQCKAVHSALKAVETRVLKSHMDAAMDGLARADKKKDREQQLDRLLALYKAL